MSIFAVNMETTTPSFNEMQTVKRHFFAMRNGLIADTLRKGGSKFRIIFGLNLPQIAEIAALTPHTAELATRLWQNSTTRESMMIAPMLYPVEEIDVATACRLIESVPEAEIADVLCHRLLRRMPEAMELVDRYSHDQRPMMRYTALRLMFNLIGRDPHKALTLAENESARGEKLTRILAMQLADEARFMIDGTL